MTPDAMDVKKMVDELREIAEKPMCRAHASTDATLRSAATALESLAADKERLTNERDEAREASEQYIRLTDPLLSCATEEPFTCGECRACYKARATLAEKSAEEMRQALKELAKWRLKDGSDCWCSAGYTGSHSPGCAIARSLLSHPTERP